MSIRYPGTKKDLSNEWYVKINIQTYQKNGLLEPLEEPFNLGTKMDGLFRPPFDILQY